MRDISISEFKANCSRLVDRVYRTRRPLRITRRGVPVAKLVPTSRRRNLKFVLGDMIGTVEIVGDIVSPVIALDELEAYRD
jgi:prevent-host-death family protein